MSVADRIRAALKSKSLSPAVPRDPPKVKKSCRPLASGALLAVVGESFYQDALEVTSRQTSAEPPLDVEAEALEGEDGLAWFMAMLLREPENEYDANAIAVWSPAGKVGHLSRGDAEKYQPVLLAVEASGDDGGVCPAFIRRRAETDMWGVVLALSLPRICMERIEAEDRR